MIAGPVWRGVGTPPYGPGRWRAVGAAISRPSRPAGLWGFRLFRSRLLLGHGFGGAELELLLPLVEAGLELGGVQLVLRRPLLHLQQLQQIRLGNLQEIVGLFKFALSPELGGLLGRLGGEAGSGPD